MEGLNSSPSVRLHLEANVWGFRRSLQTRNDGTERRFVFCAPRAVRKYARRTTRSVSNQAKGRH
ncbi:unnamed protein product [Prunus armeniaca]